jgi:uncharacterized protein (DUF2141 family)
MKKIFILFSVVLFTQMSLALNVTVKGLGLKSNKGTYRCLIFASADGFPGTPAKAKQSVNGTIIGTTGQCVFSNLVAGNYAVSTFHDENNNQKIDKNLVGMPKEKYGFSRNASKPFGPPEFSEAAFSISANTIISINLK